ncbi:hypothetical protein ACFVR2_07230 [Gottfriedia sp. NPDC057991]
MEMINHCGVLSLQLDDAPAGQPISWLNLNEWEASQSVESAKSFGDS